MPSCAASLHLSCTSIVRVAGGKKRKRETSPTAACPAVPSSSSELLLEKRESLFLTRGKGHFSVALAPHSCPSPRQTKTCFNRRVVASSRTRGNAAVFPLSPDKLCYSPFFKQNRDVKMYPAGWLLWFPLPAVELITNLHAFCVFLCPISCTCSVQCSFFPFVGEGMATKAPCSQQPC